MLYGLPGSEGVRYGDPILKNYIQKVAARNLLLWVGCYSCMIIFKFINALGGTFYKQAATGKPYILIYFKAEILCLTGLAG